ncbi:quinone oxidoreductase [Myxococcus sp. CA056]|uniref:quinone oxidoreductase family protein n=1 Tax=unclassified Myxococcus TaxID=2648731 RepID=UPI00157A8923|nr:MULTISPECIES: quinone oxidoreductase [unclassified Myxococcus]NTX10668.1 quinone oxidoreductase [Myxococcus sp. CA056]NTX50710.1 quinone oxidoreductase [Myxococcus sp. CA039A]
MKAIRYHEVGGPEVLRLDEVPEPTPGPGEVRIRVKAAGVNFADTERRRGLYDATSPLPRILGSEAAGIVDGVGPGVDAKWVGRRVVALAPRSYAEFATTAEEELLELPEHVSFEEAAGLLVQGLTAWHLIHTSAQLQQGQRVLIHAAAGGVGLLAIQLAKQAGATVLGTVSSEEKAKLARESGADDVFVYGGTASVAEWVRTVTQGAGVEVVLDSVGASTWASSLESLAAFGHLVAYGSASGPPAAVEVETLYAKSLKVSAYWLRTPHPAALQRRAREALGSALAGGQLRVKLGLVVGLEEAAQAHQRLESRATVGKVVLRVP